MEYVKLITGVIIEEVPLMGREEIPYIQPRMTGCRFVEDAVMDLNAVEHIEHAKVMRFKESNTPDMYIAWTPEVERNIGVPMRVMLGRQKELEEENKALNRDINLTKREVMNLRREYSLMGAKICEYREMTLWQRIKWVFNPTTIC